MSKDDNVIPLRPTPNHFTDQEFASSLFDYAVQGMKDEAARLVPELFFHEPKPELETYIDCIGAVCTRPKGEGERIRRENWERDAAQRQRHAEAVRQEVTERHLTEIDPEWRDRFQGDWQRAELHYWEEIEAKRPRISSAPLLYRGAFEPDDYGRERRVSDPDEE